MHDFLCGHILKPVKYGELASVVSLAISVKYVRNRKFGEITPFDPMSDTLFYTCRTLVHAMLDILFTDFALLPILGTCGSNACFWAFRIEGYKTEGTKYCFVAIKSTRNFASFSLYFTRIGPLVPEISQK